MALSRVTIKEVAQEAGVSIATVYRAVNNTGRINEETRLRILETVDRLGYKANAAARGLALRKKFNILVVLPKSPDLFWDDVRKGVHRAAEQLSNYGVRIIECYHKNGLMDSRSVLSIVYTEKIDAIILSIVGMPESSELLQYAKERNIPVAAVNEDTVSQERLFFYGPDNYLAGRMAAELIKKFCNCYSKIAVISTRADYAYSTHDLRCKGFLDYFKEKHVEQHACDVYYCTAADASQFVTHLLQQKTGIKALYFDQYTTLLSSCSALMNLSDRPIVVGHEYNSIFNDYISEGVITALLVQEKVCQGYYPVMMMYQFLSTGEEPDRSQYFSNINIIVESNLRFLKHDDNGCGYE